MKNKKLFLLALLISVSILWISKGFSLEKATHEYLNQTIAQRTINEFSLDSYLINNLGFTLGVQEPLTAYSEVKKIELQQVIWRWVGEGGIQEDNPEGIPRQIIGRARNQNHFHNPLEPWDQAGLHVSPYAWQSSIVWAQNPDQSPGGRWSWYDARNYFFQGLTITDKKQRDSAMANCFRALGQLMHLVQDASVPAHVRGDVHLLYMYEDWVEDIRNNESATFGKFIADPILFDKSILDPEPNSLAPIPIAKIVDTDRYNRNNPDVTVTFTNAIGIAEYTNANFFSEDTIFSANFPFPSWENREKKDYAIPDPRGIKPSKMRPYYVQKDDRGEEYRLATDGFLLFYITKYFPLYQERSPKRKALDGGVYNDYAMRLLPRAVGYSAGLLEYFFRGTLEISIPEDKVFSIMKGIDNTYWLTSIRAKVKNTTPKEKTPEGKILSYEEMKKGEIRAVLSYKKGSADEYSYSVSNSMSIESLSSEDLKEFNFDFGDYPIPSDIREAYLHVIFKGTLGNEKDSAIAVGMKNLPPQFIEITLPGQGVYAQAEDPDKGFSEIKLLVRNIAPAGFEMTDGSIELAVQYRLALEDPFQSKPVLTTEEFYYIVAPETNNTRNIPRDSAVELSFGLSQNPIPINATDLYLQVVYKGKLGKEEGGVWTGELEGVAVGFKDISEPTPIDLFNDMDRVCLNGNWYVAGSPEAIAQVDSDHDGIAEPGEGDVYPHDLKDMYIRFSSTATPQNASSTEYNLHIPSLGAGQFFLMRAFVLSDYEFSYGYFGRVLKKDIDPYVHGSYGPGIYLYKGVKNQTEPGTPEQCAALDVDYPCDVRYYPNRFYSFRGQQIWEWVLFQNPSYPPDSPCPLE